MKSDFPPRVHGFRLGNSLLALVLAVSVIGGGGSAFGQKRINKSYFGDVAIHGFDPVAYFTRARARQGSEGFAYPWAGANWYFVNADHRDKFAANPEKYAPRYGGFCVNNAAIGRESDLDPRAWTIWQGKLYLSWSPEHSEQFATNPADFIERANANWE